MKILISGCEIANNIATMKSALKKNGHDVESCAFGDNKFYSDKNIYDFKIEPLSLNTKSSKLLLRLAIEPALRIINISLKPLHFFKMLNRKYDAYIFIWRHSYFPFGLDLIILGRLLKKKLVIIHCGDDTRYRPIQSKIDKEILGIQYTNENDSTAYENYLKAGSPFLPAFWTQKIAEWSGGKIVSLRSHATFQGKPAYFFRFPQALILDGPKNARTSPLIVHAPSNRASKGSDYVLKSIALLREQSLDFDFELIENKSNDYVLSRLKDADILIDQTGPWFGRLGMEGLASSCVVFSGNRQDYYGIKDPSPVIQFNPNANELAANLESLIKNPDRREDLMKKGYTYWKQSYSEEKFADYIESIINDERPDSLFIPIDNHKKILLRYADNKVQKLIIHVLY